MVPDKTALDIAGAVALLRQGELVAIPTETVYGLGADAANVAAVAKIFAAKQRPADHPLIVHIAGIEQLELWAQEIPSFAWKLAEHFWPGSLTLILPRSAKVPDIVTGGQDTVGLRVPAHPITLELLKQFGSGISAPSANRFGHISATTPQHVRAEFGNEMAILDGGPCSVGIESTIIDCSGKAPVLLRPGGIDAERIIEILGMELGTASTHSPKVSGSLASHYAPRTPLLLVSGDQLEAAIAATLAKGQRCGILARKTVNASSSIVCIAAAQNAHEYARHLYSRLRELDEMKLDCLIIEAPPRTGEWLAINDRLKRAAFSEN